MKKWTALLLTAAMTAALLGGCANKTASSSGNASNSSTPPNSQSSTESSDSSEWTPDGPITIVVGMAAGGGIDTMARTMAAGIGEYLGVDVIVENMPGSSSGLAADYVTEQPAVGYSIFACSSSI